MRYMIRNAVLALYVTSLSLNALADRIHLKNGRSVEGIIKQETREHVLLDLGVGSMKIRHSKIDRIERADKEEQNRLHEKWRDRYFTNRRYVPTGYRPIADRLRALTDRRAAAVRARKLLSEAEAEEHKIQSAVSQSMQELTAVGRQIKASGPHTDPTTYNALVMKSNSIKADVTAKQGDFESLKRRLGLAAQQISEYLETLTELEEVFEKAVADAGSEPGTDERSFLDHSAKQLTLYASEFSEISVNTEERGGWTVVNVLVNGTALGRFILDTGASIVSLSDKFAARAGITANEEDSLEMLLADGTKTEAKGVVLASVQIGKARVEHVPAVILPSVVRDDIDGLLGMSFLRNFVMRFDGATGRLVLKHFTPK